MANFDTIKTAIDANIKTNGTQDITGGKMNSILKQMVDATDEQLTELESELDIFKYKGHLDNKGNFVSSTFGYVTPFLVIPKENETFVCFETASQYNVVPSICTYDKYGNFVKSYYGDESSSIPSGEYKGKTTLIISNMQDNEVYMRIREHNQNTNNYFGDYPIIQLRIADFDIQANSEFKKNLPYLRSELMPDVDLVQGYYVNKVGIVESVSFIFYAEINVLNWYGIKIIYPAHYGNGVAVRFLDANRNVIHVEMLQDNQEVVAAIVPHGAVYAQYNTEYAICYRVYNDFAAHIADNIVPELFTIPGKTEQFLLADGTLVDSNLQLLTDFIRVPYTDANKTSIRDFIILGVQKISDDIAWGGVHFYDKDFAWLGRILPNYANKAVRITLDVIPKNALYFRASPILSKGYLVSTIKLAEIPSSEENKDVDVLHGKTWYCCGDSFSHGDYSNSATPETSYKFQSGKYVGLNKVYSRFIALRHHMDLHLLAQNGATIGMHTKDSQQNNAEYNPKTDAPEFPNNFYWQQFPQIVGSPDYITMWFGINDAHNCPLGTVDDNSVKTFCGALNWSLSNLIARFPFAKIGVIISNGYMDGNLSYRNAMKDCCRKWAIPYLDMCSDESVPYIVGQRVINGDIQIAPAVTTVREQNFYVSSNNGHPNEFAHEYESTFIENWLRTL